MTYYYIEFRAQDDDGDWHVLDRSEDLALAQKMAEVACEPQFGPMPGGGMVTKTRVLADTGEVVHLALAYQPL